MKQSTGGGNKILGTVRSPMSGDLVGRPMVPARAASTTMPGISKSCAPISSPQAPFVSMGRKGKQ